MPRSPLQPRPIARMRTYWSWYRPPYPGFAEIELKVNPAEFRFGIRPVGTFDRLGLEVVSYAYGVSTWKADEILGREDTTRIIVGLCDIELIGRNYTEPSIPEP